MPVILTKGESMDVKQILTIIWDPSVIRITRGRYSKDLQGGCRLPDPWKGSAKHSISGNSLGEDKGPRILIQWQSL